MMKRSLPLAAAAALTTLLAAPAASALGAGISGNSGKAAGTTCALATCHAPGAAVPEVTITGPAEMAAGASQEFTLEITTALAKGSCGIAGSEGVTFTAGADLQVQGGELTHKAGGIAATGGKASFKFTVKAPASGTTFTLFAAGLGSDGAAATGDGMKTVTKEITLTGGAPAGTSTSSSSGSAGGDDDDEAAADDRFSEDPFTEADAAATCATTHRASSDSATAAFFALAAIAVAVRGSTSRRRDTSTQAR